MSSSRSLSQSMGGVTSAPVKRAGRPPRLSAPAVVAAAVAIADADGLGALSMPKLARSLGVGTMTVYGYVANKSDLMARMALSLIDEVVVADTGTWEERITVYFRALRTCALDHPSLPELLAAVPVDTLSGSDSVEGLIGLMNDAGLDLATAERIFHAALVYTVGFVIWDRPQRSKVGQASAGATTLSGSASAERSARRDRLGRFDWGLQAILSGAGAAE